MTHDQALTTLLALFSQRFGSSFRSLDGKQWRSMSRYHYLNDEEMLASFSDKARVIRACEPDSKASFFVITCGDDLGVASEVVGAFKSVMPASKSPKVYRQGQSGSIQIYLSFDRAVSTEAMRDKLSACFDADLVFHGTEEPFVLPLQPGFVWLNDDLAVSTSRDELNLEDAARKFLNDLSESAFDPALLEGLTSPVIMPTGTSAEVVLTDEIEEVLGEEVTSAPEEVPVATVSVPDALVEVVEQVLPDGGEALPSIPVDGGHQLLLFGISQEVVRSELPKEIPKRAKRAAVTPAPEDVPEGFNGLKLFPGIEQGAALAAKPKRRSTKAST